MAQMPKKYELSPGAEGFESYLPLDPARSFELSAGFKGIATRAGLAVPLPAGWRDPLVWTNYQTPPKSQYKGRTLTLFLPTLPLIPRKAIVSMFGDGLSRVPSEVSPATEDTPMTTSELFTSIRRVFVESLPEECRGGTGGVQLDFTGVRSRVVPNGKAPNRHRIFELKPDEEQMVEMRYRYLVAISEAARLKPDHPILRAKPNSNKLKLAGLAIGAVEDISTRRNAAKYRSASNELEGHLGDTLFSRGPRKLTLGPLLFNPKHNPKVS